MREDLDSGVCPDGRDQGPLDFATCKVCGVEHAPLRMTALTAEVEATAKLRDEDYQLAYAVDILKGLAAVDLEADRVPPEAKPAVTGEGSGTGKEGAAKDNG